MRRSDPDALTPREQQVLDLLKRGYSNRDIANELQISVAGAKYHVSEIISKLGVANREDAASWRPGSARRWAFVPAFLGAKLDVLPAGLTIKVGAGITAAALLGIAVLGLAENPESGAATGASGLDPLPTAELPCPTPDDPQSLSCRPIVHVQLASWDEAQPLAGWTVLEPNHIPAGYERERLTYSYAGGSDKGGPQMATVSVKYLSHTGAYLIVSQGYWLTLGTDDYFRAPEEYRGRLTIGGREVLWINGNAVWEQRADGQHQTDRWDEDSLGRYRLVWEEKGDRPVDLAWEKSPAGTVTVHPLADTLAYVLSATELPLEELIKVAESMLQD